MSAATDLIRYAISQLGTAEDPLGSNKQPYGAMLDTMPWYLYKEGDRIWIHQVNGQNWCTELVDASFITVFGIDKARKMLFRPTYNNYGAVVKYAFNYFKNAGRGFTKENYDPKPGDVIYFQNSEGLSHTGIVVDVSSSTVTTVEGNSGKNNWYVAESTYNKKSSYIYGYGCPDYSEDPKPTPDPKTLDGYTVGEKYKVICKDTLNVRTKATTNSSIVTALNPGTSFVCKALTRDDKGNTWMRIDDPASGWICCIYEGDKYVVPVSDPKPKTIDGFTVGKTYKVNAKKGLNVRTGPSKSYKILEAIPYGTKVTCYDVTKTGNDTWVKISKESKWVAAHFNDEWYLV